MRFAPAPSTESKPLRSPLEIWRSWRSESRDDGDTTQHTAPGLASSTEPPADLDQRVRLIGEW